MSSDGYEVKVYIYDLSKGMARAMSQAFLGKQIDGIWHTGIVVYGKEYFYGGTGGIECCPPGGTILGQPDTVKNLGRTQIPEDMFIDYLGDLAQSRYRPDSYHLLEHNCNTFSSDVAQFLTGNDIPSHITGLPSEVLSTPFGQMIKPMIDAMSVQPSGGHALFPSSSPGQSNSTSTKGTSNTIPASASQTTQPQTQALQEKSELVSKPFVFTKDCPELSFWDTEANLPEEDRKLVKEVYEFLSEQEPTWSLGRNHMTFLIGLVLEDSKGCECEALQVISRLVRNKDIVQMMQHDSKSSFPEILEKYEYLATNIQCDIVKMVSNCCCSDEGWSLLQQDRLGRLTTRTCVSALCGDSPTLNLPATALAHNMCLRKLHEDTELEIGSALLHCVSQDLDEQSAYNLLMAIYMLAKRNSEVRGLASVLGINVESYKKMSERVKIVCDCLTKLF